MLPKVSSLVALTEPVPGTARAIYGFNVASGGKNVGWAVVADGSGFRFIADTNHDGTLRGDRTWPLARGPDGWVAEVELLATVAGAPAPRTRIVFDGTDVHEHTETHGAGILRLGSRALPFVIACQSGDCSTPAAVIVGLDLDGDGTPQLEPGSYERFPLRAPDRRFVIDGRAYELSVREYGRRLAVREVPGAPPRPALVVGTAAPEVQLNDRGSYFPLSTTRGHVVVLDFFTKFCGPCKADAPWLAALHARYGNDLRIVTISDWDSRDSELLDRAHAPWAVHIDQGEVGPIAALFRVDAYPTYFVLDRDGMIRCARCKRENVDATVAQLLPR